MYLFPNVSNIFNGLYNEDHGNEQSKVFFSETSDVANISRSVKSNKNEQQNSNPDSDAESEGKILPFPAPGIKNKHGLTL